MPRLPVTLLPLSNVAHLRQIFTGFHELQREGAVALRYVAGAGPLGLAVTNDLDREAYCLGADVPGVGRIVYDVHDSTVVVPALLAGAALYFKRSYDPAVHRGLPTVHPLGLNLLFEDRPGLAAAIRALRFGRGRTRAGDALRALGIAPPYTARAADFAHRSTAHAEPRILFMTRAWPVDGFYGASAAETRDRRALNELRAATIRHLRNRYGARFTGGFLSEATAHALYPDLVLPPEAPTRKDRYLRALVDHDICIATRGLLGSTGWKFAEYLGTGRAIVSEEMATAVPGPLAAGVHYLPFATPAECLAAVDRLCADRAARAAMMAANALYFDGFVRPGALVRRTLAIARAPGFV